MSKATGAGIKALRYYERINILKPVYVDPDSGYRYYSFNQTYLVEMIRFCIELDIPLKELSRYIDGQDTIDFAAFLAHGKEVAGSKLKVLQNGLRFIRVLEKKIAQQGEHPLGQIYTRELPEKAAYTVPYEQSFDNVDQYELTQLFLDTPFEEYDEYDMIEYGYLCEYTPSGVQRYVFVEVPNGKVKPDHKIIPAGQYHCRQNDIGQIEQAREVFNDYLAGRDSFIAVETEVFSGKVDANKPVNELRVISLFE
jgi:DNA-binding transcriptional MerR regulator